RALWLRGWLAGRAARPPTIEDEADGQRHHACRDRSYPDVKQGFPVATRRFAVRGDGHPSPPDSDYRRLSNCGKELPGKFPWAALEGGDTVDSGVFGRFLPGCAVCRKMNQHRSLRPAGRAMRSTPVHRHAISRPTAYAPARARDAPGAIRQVTH